MGITRLTGFTGSADILGILRDVSFSGGGLIIEGLDLSDAHAILNHLSIGTLVSVGKDPFADLPKVSKPDPRKDVTAAPLVGTTPDREDRSEGTAPRKGAAETAAVTATKPPTMPQDAPAPQGGTEPSASSAPTVEAPPAQQNAQSEGVPEAVKKANRLNVVLDYLISLGVQREKTALLEACEKHKGQIPFLARATNLPGRIEGFLEL